MINYIAVNGNRSSSITIDSIECEILGNQKLGCLLGQKEIETKNIMYSSDDGFNNNQSLLWKGIERIRVDKPKKQWHYCKCGMVIRHTNTTPNHKRQMGFPIPYPDQHPKASVIKQITYIRGGKY